VPNSLECGIKKLSFRSVSHFCLFGILTAVSEDVIFDDDENDMVGNIQIVPGAPTGMLAWLIKSKITKNGEQSEQFLYSQLY
jgi:hypothetical protein